LLKREKGLTRLRDRLAAERRQLPWVKIDKQYVFDGPEGELTLADLFDGRSQLFIKHFMLGPGQTTQCVGCSLEVDHIEGILIHLNNHDVSYVAVARAPIEEIEVMRKRMGVEISLCLVLPLGFQLRFQRLFHSRRRRHGSGALQLRPSTGMGGRNRRPFRRQRLFQR
jgi:predicted dithiol-disulfide oxidoreductase (DUF899 family)